MYVAVKVIQLKAHKKHIRSKIKVGIGPQLYLPEHRNKYVGIKNGECLFEKLSNDSKYVIVTTSKINHISFKCISLLRDLRQLSN